jgi:hypothetical protein
MNLPVEYAFVASMMNGYGLDGILIKMSAGLEAVLLACQK